METLQEDRDLNDKVINHFFNLLQKRIPKNDCNIKGVSAFPTHFFERWDRNNDGYEGVKSWVKENPFEQDMIFFPIHVKRGNGHWALIVVRPKKLDIASFDSTGGEHNLRLEQVKDFMTQEMQRRKRKINRRRWIILNMLKNSPQQQTTHDCGVFVCLTADLLSKDQTLKVLANKSSRELRDILKRKIKWMGQNIQDPKAQKNYAPLTSMSKTRSTLPNTETQTQVPTKTPSMGSNREGVFLSVWADTQSLNDTQFLESALKPFEELLTRSPDELIQEMNGFINDEEIDASLFPHPPTRPVSVTDLVASLGLNSPGSPTTTDASTELKPTSMEGTEESTTSSPSLNTQHPLHGGHRNRGQTIRKRIFVNGKYIRMNKRKLLRFTKTQGFDWTSFVKKN